MLGAVVDGADRGVSSDARSRKRIAILAHGSRGDIQPMVAVADELVRRGHDVALTVNSNLAEWAGRSGVEVLPMAFDGDEFLRSEGGRTLLSSGKLVDFSRELARREAAANRVISQTLIDCCRGADLIVSTVLTVFRATAIAERFGTNHGMMTTMPVQPTRAWANLLAPVRQLRVGALNRASFHATMSVWWRSFAPCQAELREMLGLPADSRRPAVERLPSAGAYSEVLVPRPADWDGRHQITGFATLTPELRERLGEAQAPDGLEDWLERGAPPVYFGFGSLPVLDPRALLRSVAAVTRRLGLRALVGAGWTDYGSTGTLPDHVFLAAAFDHDRLLPKCAAAVHHGGAGTTATALRAGLPALVVSSFGDQPFWGWRVQQAGVGLTLSYRKLDETRLERALDRLLDPRRVARARSLASALRAERGTARTADVIEHWLARGTLTQNSSRWEPLPAGHGTPRCS